MVFLYNGGDCDQSFNVQGDLFFCTDLNGGPPTERGTKSYIIVTDTKDQGIIYHDDWVTVGETFTLSDGGENFEANQIITIYSSNETSNPDNIIQSIQYHSSCSSNLFLKDRFGATQLVIWVNEDQGVVSCFANQTFDLDITIPIDIVGGPATITSLTVASNIDPFFFNLTDKVAGTEAAAGDTLSVSVAVPIDLTQQKTYNLLVTVFAVTQTGQICRATELTSFTAGYPLPPIFPTFAPTSAPSGTPPPTPDPETSICNLEADISCRSSSGLTCRNLVQPTATVCNSDGSATAASFLFTGNSCGATPNCQDVVAGQSINEDRVYVTVVGNNGAVVFNDIVQPAEIISVSNGLDRQIAITVFTVDETTGGQGTQLQQISRIRTECDGQAGRDLTLLQDIGAFQVTGFTNTNQGKQSVQEQLTLTYKVTNEGPLAATLTSAVKTQPGITELLTEGDIVPAGFESVEFVDTVNINLVNGGDFRYDFFVAGTGTASNGECFDDESYVFNL